MNVLLISPDTTENPFGGMGVQMKGLQKADSPINFKFQSYEPLCLRTNLPNTKGSTK